VLPAPGAKRRWAEATLLPDRGIPVGPALAGEGPLQLGLGRTLERDAPGQVLDGIRIGDQGPPAAERVTGLSRIERQVCCHAHLITHLIGGTKTNRRTTLGTR